MRFKKGSELVTGRTISILLGLFLLIVVFGIIFALDPNFLYKLLPNYNVETETGDEVIGNVDDLIGSPCERLGMVTVGKLEQGGCISLIENQDQAYTSRKCTDLIYDKNKDYDATIKSDIAKDWKWSLDIATAKKTVENGKEIYDISVNSYYLDENSEIYIKKLFGENYFKFTAEQLAILNGAQYRSNYICKKVDPNTKNLLTGYKASWPENSPVLTLSKSPINDKNLVLPPNLRQEKVDFGLLSFEKTYNVIDLSPYFKCISGYNCGFSDFLYYEKQKDFTEVYYLDRNKKKTFGPLLRIAKDGSVWLDEDVSLVERRANDGSLDYLYIGDEQYSGYQIDLDKDFVGNVFEGFEKIGFKISEYRNL